MKAESWAEMIFAFVYAFIHHMDKLQHVEAAAAMFAAPSALGC